jgi:Prolipoprotein diacylglyceryl transferase
VLVWLGHHRRIKPPGLFALYVFGYSAYRIFEESLRIDSSVHIFGLRLNMYIATILAIVGAVWFYRIQRRPQPAPAPSPDSDSASAAASADADGSRPDGDDTPDEPDNLEAVSARDEGPPDSRDAGQATPETS